mmetsp:Transcript_56470/g.178667  ORF Transcript_56470/g.178667 Transcript_56470/m.178667 type:complete len:328 (+) Transcript_56470:192-1175(+)|eukprot:CAMPEP_0182865986 /NCGR_PEP_ID=MMETSP0034_2-20130328/7977_1 /TAXON_ID=156128 /ORGANISM="Nephroselmis pyriformis, Strain CCMP717" /LENGTH=327 /DNA_ID=CAMNT_0024998309 /DNA_START=266 /DNA_END=1249 /DNA_ORIENTATION=-
MPTDKYGFFSETAYLAIGDPYLKKGQISDREKGLNFKATHVKSGNRATFNKFIPQYVGEKYCKTIEEKKEAMTAKKEAKSSDKPFKPSNPMKESSGLGGYYGTVGGKNEHLTDNTIVAKQKGMFEPPPRNIMTSPQKKGSYGTHGTTLGHKISATGAVGEYSYLPHPYDAEQKLKIAAMKADKESRFTDKPFKPSSPPKRGGAGVPGRTLNGKGPGVSGEYEYKELGPEAKVKAEVLEKPFFPSKPPKEGYNCTLNKFPEHVPDPEEVRVAAKKAAQAAAREKLGEKAPMFPPPVPKSSMTPSVLRMSMATEIRGPNSPHAIRRTLA